MNQSLSPTYGAASGASACPLCGHGARGEAFPYATHYHGQRYRYLGCAQCRTRFIDPLPDAAAFAAMYAPDDYHAAFYADDGQGDYGGGAARLAAHLPPGSRILDYGCGSGHFITAAIAAGLKAEGAEHSAEAAAAAAARSGATVHDLSRDDWYAAGPWDCVHLGDVIEHLPHPQRALGPILDAIQPGGWLSIEGPLEANPSLVHSAIELAGWLKRQAGRPEATFAPYHLFFTDAAAQRAFFDRLGQPLDEVYWDVIETGWPYRHNGALRNVIAIAAIGAHRIIPGSGNRFRALFRKRG